MRSAFAIVLTACALLAGCATDPTGRAPGEVQTASDQTENQKRAQIRMQLAVGYFEQGQMPIALDEIKQALQIDPNYADAYSVRGLIYMQMGESALADDSFQRALRLSPNNPDFSNNYGWFLCQNGRERQAMGYFDAALKSRQYQSPAKAYTNAGLCSLKLNDMPAAESYLNQAFTLDPGSLENNVGLAKLNYRKGDFTRAKFYISRVTKADYLTADVLWTAIRIERKLGDRAAENGLATQLRRRHPNSPELAAYLRGAFDE